MNRKFFGFSRIIAAILAISCLFGCSGGHISTPEPSTGNTPDPHSHIPSGAEYISVSGGNVGSDYVDSVNSFASRMLLELGDGWTGVVSPLSVQLSMQLLANGASPEVQEKMLAALGYSGSMEDMNYSSIAFIRTLLAEWDKDSAKFSIANAVYADKDKEFIDSFVKNAYGFYDADLGSMDFSDEKKSVDAINAWVKEKTNGMIDEIVGELPYDTLSVILNAIYFKALWNEAFTAYKSTSEFHGLNGDSMVTMLFNGANYQYASFSEGEMLLIPYMGGEYSMALVLPGESYTPSSAMAALIGRWNECEYRNCNVTMPSVELSTDLDMIPILSKMGFSDAVNAVDTFDGIIAGEELAVGLIRHAAKLKVTERGTEAGAATVIANYPTAAEPTDIIDFTCNRPYAMAIVNNATGAVIFVSCVNDL